MKFRQTGEGTLEILLSTGELSALELGTKPLDGSDPLTRRILTRLIRRAEQETGIPLCAGTFLVELASVQEGAVLTVRRALPPSHREEPRQVYRFCDSEAMIRACLALGKQLPDSVRDSSLYEWDGWFYLSVVPAQAESSPLQGLLLEYGSRARRDALAEGMLREYAGCLIRENAVQTIRHFFGGALPD